MGRPLLAHELAHVVQQSRGGSTASSTETDACQAESAPDSVGGVVDVRTSAPPAMARNGLKIPAVTAEELIERLVISVRGFASSPPAAPVFEPAGVGSALGRGYETYA